MRLYPATPAARTRTMVRDAVAILLLVLFAWLGARVHDAVDDVAVLGAGVRESGTLVQDGLRQAGDEVRTLGAAARLLGDPAAPGERRRLIAERAAFSLPADVLLRHSGDPLGDLAAGRFDPLVDAAFAHAGLAPPPLWNGEARA